MGRSVAAPHDWTNKGEGGVVGGASGTHVLTSNSDKKKRKEFWNVSFMVDQLGGAVGGWPRPPSAVDDVTLHAHPNALDDLEDGCETNTTSNWELAFRLAG